MDSSVARNIRKEENLTEDVARMRQLLTTLGRKRSLRDPLASACEQMQLTPSQVHALMWLGQDGALTMGELARRIGITEKTVTGVVDRLEREGLVQRERSAADRRVIHCALTTTGQQTYQRLDRMLQEQLGLFLELLDATDRKALFRLLERLVWRLDGSKPPA
jgi:DNA-binding MarR family transcriptional regulator